MKEKGCSKRLAVDGSTGSSQMLYDVALVVVSIIVLAGPMVVSGAGAVTAQHAMSILFAAVVALVIGRHQRVQKQVSDACA